MSLAKRTQLSFIIMVTTLLSMCVTVSSAAQLPDADMLAQASASQLLAWAVVVEAIIIVALSGTIVQAYRNRVKALEHQIEACRTCATNIAAAMKERGAAPWDDERPFPGHGHMRSGD